MADFCNLNKKNLQISPTGFSKLKWYKIIHSWGFENLNILKWHTKTHFNQRSALRIRDENAKYHKVKCFHYFNITGLWIHLKVQSNVVF